MGCVYVYIDSPLVEHETDYTWEREIISNLCKERNKQFYITLDDIRP